MRHFALLFFFLIAGCASKPQDNMADSSAKSNEQLSVQDNQHDESDPSPGLLKKFARPCFTFDYPAAWKVNEKDKEYDPDHFFILEPSFNVMMLFDIVDELRDPAVVLSERIKSHSERLKTKVHKEFDEWGLYKGWGGELHGDPWGGALGNASQETYRAFVFNLSGKTFTLVEAYPDKEKRRLASGYRTIEESFRVLQPREGKAADATSHDK